MLGDLVSRLSNWPCGAYYGLLFGLVRSGLPKSTDHPSTTLDIEPMPSLETLNGELRIVQL